MYTDSACSTMIKTNVKNYIYLRGRMHDMVIS